MAANREGVLRMVAWLQRAYPENQHPTTERIGVYCDRLQAYPSDALAAAARSCVDACKFFPTIAELVTVLDQRGRQPGKYQPQLGTGTMTQDEVRAALDKVLNGWKTPNQAPSRQPGDDDE